jgi:dihydrofolate reductase
MRITLIAAVSENGVIGRGNALPWHLPADLQRFKRLTSGHAVIMGRKTWASIHRPHPNRRNIVVSGSPGFHPAGATAVPSIPAAIAAARDLAEVFIIGGSRVFEAALPLADRLELTRVHGEVTGDVSFPKLDLSEWKLVAEEHHPADERHAYPFSFLTYNRRQGTLDSRTRDHIQKIP